MFVSARKVERHIQPRAPTAQGTGLLPGLPNHLQGFLCRAGTWGHYRGGAHDARRLATGCHILVSAAHPGFPPWPWRLLHTVLRRILPPMLRFTGFGQKEENAQSPWGCLTCLYSRVGGPGMLQAASPCMCHCTSPVPSLPAGSPYPPNILDIDKASREPTDYTTELHSAHRAHSRLWELFTGPILKVMGTLLLLVAQTSGRGSQTDSVYPTPFLPGQETRKCRAHTLPLDLQGQGAPMGS